MRQDVHRCIQECMDCHRMCMETFAYCVRQGGELAESNHLRRLLDCSEICQTTASFLVRRSELQGILLEACAEVCRQLLEDCETLKDDLQLRACVDLCRECADVCQKIASYQIALLTQSMADEESVERYADEGEDYLSAAL